MELVLPEKQEDFPLRIPFFNLQQGVIGVASLALQNLVIEDLDGRVLDRDALEHGEAVPGLEEGLFHPKGSEKGGTKQESLEIGALDGVLGQGEVALVDGVEASAEKTDPGGGAWGVGGHLRVTGPAPRISRRE